MDHRSKLVALALWACCCLSHAGYAQLTPPAGATLSGSTVMYRAAANDVIAGGIARTAAGASLNVGGRAVVMPVAMRYASNAALFAARGAWPLLALGVLAPIAMDWVRGQGFDFIDGQPVSADPSICTVAPCYEWQVNTPSQGGALYKASTPEGVCSSIPDGKSPDGSLYLRAFRYLSPYCRFDQYRVDTGAFLATGSVTPNKVSIAPKPAQYVSAVQSDFETKMAAAPLPDALPKALPVPLPVQQPIVNPDAAPSPLPQPLWVPQGDPQPVPMSDPQQYKQPGTRITPSPSPSSPWQVDVVPDDKISNSPTPIRDPQAVPPAEAASAPKSDKPSDLCTEHPDILACQKINLGSLDPVPLPNENKQMAITPDSGWTIGSASCPAPRTVTIRGFTLTMPFTMICDFALAIKPLLIGFAWLSAALAFMGLSKKD